MLAQFTFDKIILHFIMFSQSPRKFSLLLLISFEISNFSLCNSYFLPSFLARSIELSFLQLSFPFSRRLYDYFQNPSRTIILEVNCGVPFYALPLHTYHLPLF